MKFAKFAFFFALLLNLIQFGCGQGQISSSQQKNLTAPNGPGNQGIGGPNLSIDIPPLSLEDGATVNLWGMDNILQFSRIWILGNSENIKHVFFLIHGDGEKDYSDSTSDDRAQMNDELAKRNEGGVAVYLVSNSYSWEGFSGEEKRYEGGIALFKAFRQIERAIGRRDNDVKLQSFSLSGGGKVDHGLLTLINDEYDYDSTGLDVKYFVERQLIGMHSGESVSYDIDALCDSWIRALKRYTNLRATFITELGSRFNGRARPIAQTFGGDVDTEQSLDNGRIRFLFGADHWQSWKGHFAEVFFNVQY